ncbi:GNAT family N-acetyltransferase [Pseudidiomarina aestuarii]|uniref:GNAT family N-acetyltransferase n=1 Tax=Pseudidiomarina aestuarii TaxID=624146 RepID=UPI003A979599
MTNLIVPVSRLNKNVIASFKNFDCGDSFLNQFVRNKLVKYDQKDLHKGFVMLVADELAGSFTMRVNSLEREFLDSEALPLTIPTISLEQIATSVKFRGRGFGKQLLRTALEIAVEVSSGTGVKGIHLWSHPRALDFYRSLGFHELTTRTQSGLTLTLMFLPIETIRAANYW